MAQRGGVDGTVTRRPRQPRRGAARPPPPIDGVGRRGPARPDARSGIDQLDRVPAADGFPADSVGSNSTERRRGDGCEDDGIRAAPWQKPCTEHERRASDHSQLVQSLAFLPALERMEVVHKVEEGGSRCRDVMTPASFYKISAL